MEIFSMDGTKFDLEIVGTDATREEHICTLCGSKKYETVAKHEVEGSIVEIIRCECGSQSGRVLSENTPQMARLILRNSDGEITDMSTIHIARWGKGTFNKGAIIHIPVEEIPDELDEAIKTVDEMIATMEDMFSDF